MTDCNRTIRV